MLIGPPESVDEHPTGNCRFVALPDLRTNVRQPQSVAYLRTAGRSRPTFREFDPGSARDVRSSSRGAGRCRPCCGVLSEKTRIALHVRMSFAAFMPRRSWLNGHLVLARRIDSPRFGKVEVYSPRNVLHAFRLNSPDQVDDEFASWLIEAYRVGEQRHLQQPR